jgi:hypothetical protein
MLLKKKTKNKQTKNKPKLLRLDSHSQCKSAGVERQQLYDHGYGTMIKFVSFVFFLWYIIRCTWFKLVQLYNKADDAYIS